MEELTDNELLIRMRDGDSGALGVLYIRYASSVSDFAYRFIRVREDVDDLTHNVFYKLWQHRDHLGDVDSFKAYLFMMTRNMIFKFFRHQQVVTDYAEQEKDRMEKEISDGETIVTTADLLEMINLMISRMPELQRKAFCMSRYDNMTYAEIAEQLGVSSKTVQRYVHLAVEELRKLAQTMIIFTAFDSINF